MSFSNRVAGRFLFSPKSHSVVNTISRVSMAAVGVPVAAMVVLMSVFGGFDGLIRAMYNDFDPDLAVMPAEGKFFCPDSLDIASIEALNVTTTKVLEQSALLDYRGTQRVATVRGVDTLSGGAILGGGVAYDLGVRFLLDTVQYYAPGRGTYSVLFPASAFSSGELVVDDIFTLDAETDGEMVFVPLAFAQKLFDYPGRISALAVRFEEGANEKKLKSEIQNIAGGDFVVKDRYELKASMYRIMAVEKWGIFFIGAMVLVIASLSIAGSLAMLVIDKRPGIATLRAMGAGEHTVRRIFVVQGMMIGGIGTLGGLLLGVAVCAVQQIFGVVPMPGSTFLVEAYPVAISVADIALVCAAAVAVNYIIAIFTVKLTIK